jgi:hypothetical protein
MRLAQLISVFAPGLLILSIAYLPSTANGQGNSFTQLVDAAKNEVEKKGGKLIVGITWTDAQAKPVLEEFKKDFSFIQAISFVQLRTVEQMQRMLMEYRSGRAASLITRI